MRDAILTIVLLAAMTAPADAAEAASGRDAAHQHYSQGVGLLYSGDAPGALAEFREALRLRPDLAQARFSLGTALYLNGDVDGAIEAYRAVIRQQPDLAHAHLHLGTALMVTHDWAGAQAALSTAARLQPDSVPAHYNLGRVKDHLGDRKGAVEAYREALRLDPNHADAQLYLGLALKQVKQDADATKAFLAAAQAGVPLAQYHAGAAHASGTGVRRDLATAIAWWMLAADQEVPQAKEALSHLRKMTLPTDKRALGEARVVQDAFSAYRQSLWQQAPGLARRAADESVGVSLLQAGRVVEAVPVLLHEAAALSEQAQAQLETLYVSGLDGRLPAHDRRILEYFTAAAGEGLSYPQLVLARLYAKGLGVPQDVQKARALLAHNPREEAQALLKELPAGGKKSVAR
jgi:TPR repeat protein